MIQLANDPNASRTSWRPAAADKAAAHDPRRSRTGHAWPFLSPHARRPAQQEGAKSPRNDSGS
ncbi:hypothetical protein [Ramlibacter sp. Leaf400]|uniref:hypothetical protein n=1 Tax=Ramlibacter sp. Leaf400 TaxID=1736365 RepID=UPI0006FD5A34|nr:hypothetical protein [Ramlibacter sp. Leaf400]KQT12189.1 hypothetical protein ASG30_02480 [Ramlibacter sp. Leaf400]